MGPKLNVKVMHWSCAAMTMPKYLSDALLFLESKGLELLWAPSVGM